MAEGLLRRMAPDYSVYSAGTEPGGVNPFAVKAMAENGIDISSHTSKSIDSFDGKDIDFVVTVCDSARENCPYFPATIRNMHKSFDDPSAVQGSDQEKLEAFKKIRDEIRAWLIGDFLPLIKSHTADGLSED